MLEQATVTSDEPLSKKQKTYYRPSDNLQEMTIGLPVIQNKCPISLGRSSSGADNALMDKMEITSISHYGMEELHLIDEVNEEDGSEDSESDEDENSLCDSEVPEAEIDALLEEGLPDEMKGPRSQRKKTTEKTGQDSQKGNYEVKHKVVLVDKVANSNHFEALPEGWVKISHNSGMPVYLQKETRVCTFARPYFLGSGSARKHTVPISAIPCLKWIKDIENAENEKLRKQKELTEVVAVQPQSPVSNDEDLSSLPAGPLADALVAQSSDKGDLRTESLSTNFPDAITNTRVENVEEENSLEPEVLREYCIKRFEFKTINVLRFPTWGEKRNHKKTEKRKRPQLPDGTSLISIVRTPDDDQKAKKDWVLNPKGKSYVCILHEFLQHGWKTQPKYEFKEVDNASNPYSASVYISGIKYCTGYGSSKKNAKLDCARATLDIIMPELGRKIGLDKNEPQTQDLSFFNEIRIEDPNVTDWCHKTSELSPYALLQNCLDWNYGLRGNHNGNRIGCNIEWKMVRPSDGNSNRNECVMTAGKHTVKVFCKNKKDGKQMASQAILQKMHPHIVSWGSLLRLYGKSSLQSMREKKAEEQEICHLQTKATQHQPNLSIIKKLKEKMLEIGNSKETISSFKKFSPPENTCLPSSMGTQLNNVDL